MNGDNQSSIDTLQEIRSIMNRSSRFLSLSGWSGIWAGCVALIGAFIARLWISAYYVAYDTRNSYSITAFVSLRNRLFILGIIVLVLAILGGYLFTFRKSKQEGESIWNPVTKKLLIKLFIPILAGGAFVIAFLFNSEWMYITAACLVFYGLALINAAKYTVSDIHYLGVCEVALGCISLFVPNYGLYFWALGFGVLHIFYGIIMWVKYK